LISKVFLLMRKTKKAFIVSFIASTALCPSGDLPPTKLL
jgi:hypothetical protein